MWPPPYDSFVAEPAVEAGGWIPSTDQLDWAHKALQVLFMSLALIGLLSLVRSSSARAVVRGAARKHAVA